MAIKNVVLQTILEGEVYDLFAKSGADNIIVNSETQETLAQRLVSIAKDISSATSGGVTPTQVDEKISTAIDNLIGSAPDTYDTLQEIAAYIEEHQDAFTALNSAISNKVDKEVGKGLSENDFTTALKNKLDAIAEGATKVAKSTTNGNILVNGSETVVYTHPTGSGNNHLPTGGTVGQILKNNGSGSAEWADMPKCVQTGTATPPDLAAGTLFIKYEA